MTEIRSVQELSMSGTFPPAFVRSDQLPQPLAADNASSCRGPVPPMLDMSVPGCGALMAAAAAEWGLFQVVNHGVPTAATVELQRVGRAFFALPQEEKERHRADPASGSVEGYGVGTRIRRNVEDKKVWADFFYHYVAPPAMVNHGIWPKNPAGYKEANEVYCGHVQRLTREVLEHLSAGLGLERDAMREALGGNDLVLLQKVNFYPPCPRPELALGVGSHTDMCALAVILPDEVQGLQVSRDGRWHAVEQVPGALVVVVGDQIEILSNGRYKAALHRATVSKERTRMSWPVFVEPPRELVVGPHELLAGDDGGRPARYKAKKYKDYQHCRLNLLPQ